MSKTVLETKRLKLEELDESHFEDLYSLLSNEEVHKYFPKALDRKESEDFLEKVRKRYAEDGISFWAVIRKEDGEFLGICGLFRQIIDGKEEIEVGYRISDSYWGEGYGTEAAGGCIQYAKHVLKKGSVISLVRDVNQQSIRVAEKNGMIYEGDTVFYGLPHRVYRKRFEE